MDEKHKTESDSPRELRIETDRLLLELTGAGRILRRAHVAFRPYADVYFSKSRNALIIKLELAGIDPRSVHLGVEQRLVRIEGERPDTNRTDKVYEQMEIEYGRFERVLNLPMEVDPERTTAEYKDGFLEIVLPLALQSGVRRIPVNVRDSGSDAGGTGGRQ